jgi:predicted phosphodiesterase
MKKPPKLIVHGHTHDPCDYMIGETRVICNPRGYPAEHPWYENYQPKIVEI